MAGRSAAAVKGIVLGTLFPAGALLVSWLLSLDTSMVGALIPSAFISSVLWWAGVIFGVGFSVAVSRRLWTGIVVGLLSIALFQATMVLWVPPALREYAAGSAAYWRSAVMTVTVPWAIGMVFGWTALHRRPLRNDGVVPGSNGRGA